jgi:Protein of unknown function (DUF2971)
MEQGKLLKSLTTLPKTLYHYTSMHGLLGIVNSGRIWASHIRYLNDRTEQDHLWSLIRERVVTRLANNRDANASANLTHLLSQIDNRLNNDTFVASFSAEGDLLSQWLSYCPYGNGFAIGFGLSALLTNNQSHWKRPEEATTTQGEPTWEHPGIFRVFYSSDNLPFLDTMLDIYCGSSPIAAQFLDSFDPTDPFSQTFKALFNTAAMAWGIFTFLEPFVKHQSFAAEKECRLALKSKPEQIVFRSGRSMLIPFVEYPLDRGEGYFVEKVVVGPCPDPALSRKSIEMLFRAKGHSTVEVVNSEPAYRGW